ncbi:MAG: ABC transporter ATP-binding protein [Pyramidobacter sp.]|nr:ABC transporter ATP-binding protein [Pyramidobacter sp.]
MSEEIIIKNAVKRYGDNTVIPALSAEIRNGEFFTLLGPSGCGKTTLLRMIAGFNTIEGGTISFGRQVINDVPAHQRNIGMVFQDYALFPHMTVEANVRYGLKFRDVPKAEADERVDQILKVTRIDQYRDRLPEALSGGQQQRVALARAIVIHPTVLLMDEPLSNLDAKLRIEMRTVIRDIQRDIGITTVYVTHDQEEALAISDRIAVMNAGVIQQIASPVQIYSRPANTFVAGFIGHSDFFRVKCEGGRVWFNDAYSVAVPMLSEGVSGEAVAGVRPEDFCIMPPSGDAGAGLTAKVLKKVFLGRYINYQIAMDGCTPLDTLESIELSQDISTAEHEFEEGDTLTVTLRGDLINVYSAEGGASLMKGVAAR